MLQHFALTPGNVPIAQVTTTLPVNAYFDAALDGQHRLKGPGNESTSYMMERKNTTSFSAMPVILVNPADKHVSARAAKGNHSLADCPVPSKTLVPIPCSHLKRSFN